jgi:hypothetical protein
MKKKFGKFLNVVLIDVRIDSNGGVQYKVRCNGNPETDSWKYPAEIWGVSRL